MSAVEIVTRPRVRVEGAIDEAEDKPKRPIKPTPKTRQNQHEVEQAAGFVEEVAMLDDMGVITAMSYAQFEQHLQARTPAFVGAGQDQAPEMKVRSQTQKLRFVGYNYDRTVRQVPRHKRRHPVLLRLASRATRAWREEARKV
jgi:hypothetical protein